MPTIAAVTAAILAFRNGQKTTDVGTKTDKIIVSTEKIHELTNSRLTEVTSSLSVALARIEGMEKLITSLRDSGKESEKNGTLNVENGVKKIIDEIHKK